ncbi:MAG: hypothetical protein LBC67_02600 [Spirochaetales bacterium]|nr:hypothetical protein [Spirochaetales bacterium]
MKNAKLMVLAALIAAAAAGCSSGPRVKVEELESKGTAANIPTPDWIKDYIGKGVSALQAQPQFKDKYCIVGSESGVNKQFALTWADSFSAQQRIGAMLRTNIASQYNAKVEASAQSSGGGSSASPQGTGSGDFKQSIDNSINAVVSVSYSGAQREADWWILTRRYDPDQKDVYSDEYTAYVLYTIPKAELNRQIASALETSVSKDSALYDITIALAQDILRGRVDVMSEPK